VLEGIRALAPYRTGGQPAGPLQHNIATLLGFSATDGRRRWKRLGFDELVFPLT
jgi:hypothetical protein